MQTEKLIVIGSGPAGLAAALYTGRAGLNPLVLSGLEMGGQISLTYDVDNYLGFPEGTTGPELIEMMTSHVNKFDARLQFEEVTEVDFKNGPPFTVSTHAQKYQADAVVVATGACSPPAAGTRRGTVYRPRRVLLCNLRRLLFPRQGCAGNRRRRQRN